MSIRYTDSGSRDGEFVTRERSPTIFQLILIFISIFLVSITLSMAVQDKIALTASLVVLLSAVGWYAIVQIQRNRDLVLATEFQNALFTSALGSNNKFCLIIKRDYTITYMDRAFHECFHEFVKLPYRHLDAWLKYGEVSQEECDKIYAAIEHNVKENTVFSISASDHKPHKIFMTIEPIKRPQGYVLLRARDYVEQRNAATGKDAAKSSAITKLDASLANLLSGMLEDNQSAFITDSTGFLLYTSPALEKMLGYKEREMLDRNFSIQDIIYVGGSKPDALTLEFYEGEIILQKKTGDLVKAFIRQKVIKDPQGKIA